MNYFEIDDITLKERTLQLSTEIMEIIFENRVSLSNTDYITICFRSLAQIFSIISCEMDLEILEVLEHWDSFKESVVKMVNIYTQDKKKFRPYN